MHGETKVAPIFPRHHPHHHSQAQDHIMFQDRCRRCSHRVKIPDIRKDEKHLPVTSIPFKTPFGNLITSLARTYSHDHTPPQGWQSALLLMKKERSVFDRPLEGSKQQLSVISSKPDVNTSQDKVSESRKRRNIIINQLEIEAASLCQSESHGSDSLYKRRWCILLK
nr:uncharacterized protein LOC123279053 [Equus asinus]XP_044609302.1 uncharacterized protein LOC123279053 [Equus asinus]